MMRGYDKEEALLFMLSKIDRREHAHLGDLVDKLLGQAIDADMEFMHASGVLDSEGNAGETYYEDDDAFEFIVEKIAAQNKFTPEQAADAAMLVNDYMDLQEEYMEKKGLLAWE
ncbi:MAG: hypothetical protein K6A68_02550 [Clostridiales bacterium]|nr:hypothetical protein [Clostridia bacterium]MCR4882419.1 hypothetical protein [Clostridiales bacterium]